MSGPWRGFSPGHQALEAAVRSPAHWRRPPVLTAGPGCKWRSRVSAARAWTAGRTYVLHTWPRCSPCGRSCQREPQDLRANPVSTQQTPGTILREVRISLSPEPVLDSSRSEAPLFPDFWSRILLRPRELEKQNPPARRPPSENPLTCHSQLRV